MSVESRLLCIIEVVVGVPLLPSDRLRKGSCPGPGWIKTTERATMGDVNIITIAPQLLTTLVCIKNTIANSGSPISLQTEPDPA